MPKKQVFWFFCLTFIIFWFITFSDQQIEAQNIDYIGPEACKSCHSENYDEWTESKHAEAYTDPEFQESWASTGNQQDCLECHTTGYNAQTQEYVYEGVSCETCHGPGLTMAINRNSDLCGSCHTGEYGKNRYEDFLEGTHSGSGVNCVDCHSSEKDHSFVVYAESCASCHTEDRIHSSNLITGMQSRALEAEELASELEEEVSELQSELTEFETRTQFITQLTLIGGGILLIVIIWVVISTIREKRAT